MCATMRQLGREVFRHDLSRLSFAPMKLLLHRRRGESLGRFHLSSGERLRCSMITVAWKVTPGDFWSIRGVHATFDQGKCGGYF